MSQRWLIVLALLQAATLVVLGVLVVRSDPEEPGGELRELEIQLAGALHHQLELVQYLDLLRNDLDRLLQELGVGSGDPAARPASDVPPSPAAEADVPFPEAHRHLQSLKEAFVQRAAAAGADQNFLQPFDLRIAEAKEKLLRLGADSLHWIHEELDLQPFEKGYNQPFAEYLLDELVPPLSGVDRAATFQLARSALVRVTNENRVRVAAARAMRAIDTSAWVREVLEVIAREADNKQGVSLRISLLDLFVEDPRPEVVDLCKAFLEEVRHPVALRTKAVWVLAAQESPRVVPMLHRALFEDAVPELRLAALDALYDRLGDRERDELDDLLDEVLAMDPARMPGSVQEKARSIKELLTGP